MKIMFEQEGIWAEQEGNKIELIIAANADVL